MIFPQYNYRPYNNGNKNKWPVQPPTQESWNLMHNQAIEYCNSITDAMEFKGKCEAIDLPSFHPYWKAQSEQSIYDIAAKMAEKLKKCINNPDLYRYEFNSLADYDSVSKRIIELNEKLIQTKGVEVPNNTVSNANAPIIESMYTEAYIKAIQSQIETYKALSEAKDGLIENLKNQKTLLELKIDKYKSIINNYPE